MRDLNTALCRVRQEEALHDRTCQQALDIQQEQKDQAIEKVHDEIANGEHTSDIANYVDCGDLVKIALAVIAEDQELELSRVALELNNFQYGVNAYAEEVAEGRI